MSILIPFSGLSRTADMFEESKKSNSTLTIAFWPTLTKLMPAVILSGSMGTGFTSYSIFSASFEAEKVKKYFANPWVKKSQCDFCHSDFT